MVVGKGMIGLRFESYDDNPSIVVYASGVSDSKETNLSLFEREKKLLSRTLLEHKNKIIVYFSTCGIYDKSLKTDRYIQHKIEMEELIKNVATKWLIFRVSNLVGPGGNPLTLINFLVERIGTGKKFELWKSSYRNFVDLDDLYTTVKFCLDYNCFTNRIINLANPHSLPMPEIVKTLEKFLNKSALYEETEKGISYEINIQDIAPIYAKLGINFNDDYLSKILEKYYRKANG